MLRYSPAALFALFVSLAAIYPAQAEDITAFSLPSGNIGCKYTPPGDLPSQPPGLFCERAKPTIARALLGAKGPAVIDHDVMDPTSPSDHVLRYGDAMRLGPFACVASQKGVTCKRDDGRGFFMSRSTARAF